LLLLLFLQLLLFLLRLRLLRLPLFLCLPLFFFLLLRLLFCLPLLLLFLPSAFCCLDDEFRGHCVFAVDSRAQFIVENACSVQPVIGAVEEDYTKLGQLWAFLLRFANPLCAQRLQNRLFFLGKSVKRTMAVSQQLFLVKIIAQIQEGLFWSFKVVVQDICDYRFEFE
jgi:hypothetical protein